MTDETKWEFVPATQWQWDELPIGTRAEAVMGGHWTKTKEGWQWCTGSTFPTPGADVMRVFRPLRPARYDDDAWCDDCRAYHDPGKHTDPDHPEIKRSPT